MVTDRTSLQPGLLTRVCLCLLFKPKLPVRILRMDSGSLDLFVTFPLWSQ